jgi:hypothetical protein
MSEKVKVWYLRPSAWKYKYITVRVNKYGMCTWSGFGTNELEDAQRCVEYSKTLVHLPYTKKVLEMKDVIPAPDFRIDYPDFQIPNME